MKSVPEKQPPKAYLLKDAARIAQRSLTWVRQQRRFGPLVPAEIDGLQAVTAASLDALMAQSPKRSTQNKNSRPPRSVRLFLVVDNTK